MAEFNWIPIKIRSLTEEEKSFYQVPEDAEELSWIYDCPLPESGQNVLVSTIYGIDVAPFYDDDGCYFECYEDEGEVLAWAPLPEPYKKPDSE